MVIQHRELDHFTLFDERALRTAVTQLAGAIENARFLMELLPAPPLPLGKRLPSFIKGESVGTGTAAGQILIPNQNRKSLLYGPDPLKSGHGKSDFKEAVNRTTQELKSLQERFARRLPESVSLIFTAHFMILKDKNFTGRMVELIDEGLEPIAAIKQVAQKYINLFSTSPNAYMQEKAVDVEDLSIRILSNFQGPNTRKTKGKGSIVVATELYPSDILKLVADGIKGIILVGGGATSHVTILARSLQVPLIIADDPRLLNLPYETILLLDATQGNIYFNPDRETLELFKTKHLAETQVKTQTMKTKTFSLDRKRVTLLANINLLSEIGLAILRAAHGKKDIRLMFPLISSIDEFLEARQVVLDCCRDLKQEGIAHNNKLAVGMMIELPSVLSTMDEFARLADFFAIGTNDFIQYMLGADRTNKLVANYYIPLKKNPLKRRPAPMP